MEIADWNFVPLVRRLRRTERLRPWAIPRADRFVADFLARAMLRHPLLHS